MHTHANEKVVVCVEVCSVAAGSNREVHARTLMMVGCREIMDRKDEENKDCEKSMVELKTQIGSNHRELHTLKHTLEQKQFAEWQSVLGHWESPGSLTLSMVLYNKVESRLRNGLGIPDYCRGQAWLLMQRSALLQLKQSKTNDHLYYVCMMKSVLSDTLTIVIFCKQCRSY